MEMLISIWVGLSIFTSVVWAYSKIYSNQIKGSNKRIMYTQSHIHSVVSPFLPLKHNIKKTRKSQSFKHESEHNVRVIIMDQKAYWIKNNTFFVASMLDGMVDQDSTSIVDTMGMDKVQLDKMMFIIDKLREGLYDDSGDSGNK